MKGKPLHDLIPQGLPYDGLRDYSSSHFSVVGRTASGKHVPLDMVAFPLEADNSWLLLLDPLKRWEEKSGFDLFRAEKIKADALLDAIPDTIFIQDFEGNFLEYYPALEKGMLAGDPIVKGRHMSEVLPPHVHELFYKAIDKVRKERKAQHLQFAMEKGSSGFYEARLVPMNDHMVLTIVRDVSQRMADEQALKEERSRLRDYLDSAASMFLVLRPDYTIALANQKVCDTFGKPREQLLNRNWLALPGIRGERKRLKLLFDRTIEGKSTLPEYFESPVRTRRGAERLIRWRIATLGAEDGHIKGLVCSGVDITDQKTTEQRLRRSESTKRAILEAIPDVILLQDIESRILGVQESSSHMDFFLGDTLTGRLATEVFPEDTGKQMLQNIRDACTTGKPRELEFSLDTEAGLRFYEARYVCMDRERVLAVVRDITRAKSMQHILDLRNRALEVAGNGILIADARLPDMPVIYCNAAFTRITQYTEADVLGKNCRFLQGAETEPAKVRIIKDALEKGKESRVVLRNYRKDGTLFWNELTITPILNSQGEATHFIGVQNDVSELVFEAERKDHTRQILEGITQDQPRGEIASALSRFLRSRLPGQGVLLARWSAEDHSLKALTGHGMTDAFMEEFGTIIADGSAACPCRKAVSDKVPVLLADLRHETEYGAFISMLKEEGIQSCWSFPILSSEKTVLGTCTLFGRQPGLPEEAKRELITDALQLTGLAIERDQTRARLEETNHKLESYAKSLEKDVAKRTEEVQTTVQKLLLTNKDLQEQIRTTREAEDRALANQALFGAIAKNFPKGVIMVFNREYRYVHLEGEELDRMGLGQWPFNGCQITETPGFSNRQRDDIRARIGQTLDGKHLSFEFQLGDNTYAVNSTPLHISEGTGWALLVFSNVTEQKKAEADLLRALRIEQELNDLKSRFISMASHEFRTPLSAIQSSAILIRKLNEPGNEEKRIRYLRQIQNNVRNLVVILDDFLSLSKLEEGKMECQPSTFDIMDLIRSVLEELESNLKVGQHFSEAFEMTSLKVDLDPKLVRHILVNLLSNAIKYSPEKSGIFIHIEKEGKMLKIAVRDEGMGIPEDEHEQLFNRFFRARNAVNIPGTGLGLHIVKNYTELMGGTISFESQPGNGSTFFLNLPVHLKSP